MHAKRAIYSELRQTWRWSFPMGVVTPVLSLMVGLLFQTVFYEIAHGIPSLFRQEAHVSIPICKIFPHLYGCIPGIGALTSLRIGEVSLRVGQVSGLLINLILVTIISIWVTIRLRTESTTPGILTGISGSFSSLILIQAFNVPIGINTPWGILGILALLLLPLCGWMGGRIGRDWLAKRLTPGVVSFLPVDEAMQVEFNGERLSQRELEVLTLVAEGLKNRDIASRLYISKATVKTHLIHIFAKLGVENRTSAVTQALAHGLIRKKENEIESS